MGIIENSKILKKKINIPLNIIISLSIYGKVLPYSIRNIFLQMYYAIVIWNRLV